MNEMSVLDMLAQRMEEQQKPKRRVFISFYKDDRKAVDDFIAGFADVFTPRALGVAYNDDLINSNDTDYVMQQIRKNYLGNSTVTIVMLGSCTHSRRYVDWEIKASLQQGQSDPNGLIGVLVPGQTRAYLPPRLDKNWNAQNKDAYARYYVYPSSSDVLRGWIEDAFAARKDRAKHIVNPNTMMKYNTKCRVCGVTHT